MLFVFHALWLYKEETDFHKDLAVQMLDDRFAHGVFRSQYKSVCCMVENESIFIYGSYKPAYQIFVIHDTYSNSPNHCLTKCADLTVVWKQKQNKTKHYRGYPVSIFNKSRIREIELGIGFAWLLVFHEYTCKFNFPSICDWFFFFGGGSHINLVVKI